MYLTITLKYTHTYIYVYVCLSAINRAGYEADIIRGKRPGLHVILCYCGKPKVAVCARGKLSRLINPAKAIACHTELNVLKKSMYVSCRNCSSSLYIYIYILDKTLGETYRRLLITFGNFSEKGGMYILLFLLKDTKRKNKLIYTFFGRF